MNNSLSKGEIQENIKMWYKYNILWLEPIAMTAEIAKKKDNIYSSHTALQPRSKDCLSSSLCPSPMINISDLYLSVYINHYQTKAHPYREVENQGRQGKPISPLER